MGDRHRLTLLCGILLAGASVTGCALNRGQGPGGDQAGGVVEQQFHTRNVGGEGGRARDSVSNQMDDLPVKQKAVQSADAGGTALITGRHPSGNSHADRVAELALQIPGVVSSAAIASGRVVLIGVALSDAARSKDFPAIRREIRRRVSRQVPDFRYVYITADAGQVAEISQMADGLRQGQPLSGYHQRIERLLTTMHLVPSR